MRNALRLDERITIGPAPDGRELILLSSIGFKTVIDLRDEDEKITELVKTRCADLKMRYVGIPITRDRVDFEDVLHFYLAAYEPGMSPIYAFSRRGRRPLAFLLLLQAVNNDEPVTTVFSRASSKGFDLEQDPLLRDFLIDFRDRWRMKEIVEMLRQLRPDLLSKKPMSSGSWLASR